MFTRFTCFDIDMACIITWTENRKYYAARVKIYLRAKLYIQYCYGYRVTLLHEGEDEDEDEESVKIMFTCIS